MCIYNRNGYNKLFLFYSKVVYCIMIHSYIHMYIYIYVYTYGNGGDCDLRRHMRKGKHSVLVFIWSGWIGTLLSTYKKHKRQAERGWRMRQCHFFFLTTAPLYSSTFYSYIFSDKCIYVVCLCVCKRGR